MKVVKVKAVCSRTTRIEEYGEDLITIKEGTVVEGVMVTSYDVLNPIWGLKSGDEVYVYTCLKSKNGSMLSLMSPIPVKEDTARIYAGNLDESPRDIYSGDILTGSSDHFFHDGKRTKIGIVVRDTHFVSVVIVDPTNLEDKNVFHLTELRGCGLKHVSFPTDDEIKAAKELQLL